MTAGASLLAELRRDGLTVSRHDGCLIVAPRVRLTDELRTVIRQRKQELLADLQAEQDRRQGEVRRMLSARQGIKRAFTVELTIDGGAVVTLGLRRVGICELIIPPCHYDAGALLEFFSVLAANESASEAKLRLANPRPE